MEYKSPLQDEYYKPSNHGPLHSRTLGGGRYAPYTHRKIEQKKTPTPSSEGSHSSHHNSTQHKYTDQYKPANYPKELTAMFGASECKLCSVEMSSPIVAKMHYSGKQHLKNIKLYLIGWSQKTGLYVPDVNVNNSANKSIFPEYCHVCNVQTKSVNEQLQHYSGKFHRKNMLDPTNTMKKKKVYEEMDPSGRFGIGNEFSSKVPEIKNEIKNEEIKEKSTFICELCDVTAVSAEQLECHLSGKKHKEKLEKKDSKIKKRDKPWKCTVCNVSLDTIDLYNLHMNGKRHLKAISKTKINGKDCCEICGVSFTSLEHYQDHMSGKKHEKALAKYQLSQVAKKNMGNTKVIQE